jgi:hypothetical protein
VTETDVVDSCAAVEKYKMRLQNMLGERGIAQRMITASDFVQALLGEVPMAWVAQLLGEVLLVWGAPLLGMKSHRVRSVLTEHKTT